MSMTSDQFKRWQKHMGWSNSRAARELCVGERQVCHYRAGDTPVSPMVERLCNLLEQEERRELLEQLASADAEPVPA